MRKLELGEKLAVIFILCMGVYATYVHFGTHMYTAALIMWSWVKEDLRFSRAGQHFLCAGISIAVIMIIIEVIEFRLKREKKESDDLLDD